MTELDLRPNIDDPDGFYAELLAAHEGLSDDESAALNARLVLVLANIVGARDTLSQAIAVAAKGAERAQSPAADGAQTSQDAAP